MAEEACRNCKFWRQNGENANQGTCHHGGPLALPLPVQLPNGQPSVNLVGYWPPTPHSEWCGDFQQGIPITTSLPPALLAKR